MKAEFDPEFFELWVSSLESGEYAQAQEYLRRDYPDGIRYCCLGVACDVYIKKFGEGEWEVSGAKSTAADNAASYVLESDLVLDEYIEVNTELPTRILNLLGLTIEEQDQCIRMNDGVDTTTRHTFKEIAAFLRAERAKADGQVNC